MEWEQRNKPQNKMNCHNDWQVGGGEQEKTGYQHDGRRQRTAMTSRSTVCGGGAGTRWVRTHLPISHLGIIVFYINVH